MTLNEHLVKLAEYGIGFNMYEGTVIVNVFYPKKWSVLKSQSTNINISPDDGRYYYWANIAHIDELFDLIYLTIDYNKGIEEKAALFKVKIDEMQKLFVNEDLETLKTLEFKLKRKKQPKKVAKETEIPEDTVEENNDKQQEETEVVEETIKEETTNETELSENDKKIAEAVEEMNKQKGD